MHDRQTLRLKGQGMPGFEGGPPGDAYVEVHIQPHALFERKDSNVHVELPVSLAEAVLGGRIEVPTIDGPVSMTVPKGSNSGTTLAPGGRGILDPKSGQRGDQYVRLQVVLPKTRRSRARGAGAALGGEPPLRPARRAGGPVMRTLAEVVLMVERVDRVELHPGSSAAGCARRAGAAASRCSPTSTSRGSA